MHICVLIKLPFKQAVAVPVRVKPALHASEQLLPEERTDEQVPRVPFAGADTAQAFAAHDCAVKTPLLQDVTGPTRLKPELHAKEQVLPEARTDGQVPMKPFAGADTGHAIPAALPEMGMLKRPAASHPIILFFIILSLRPRRYLPIWMIGAIGHTQIAGL